MNRRRPPAGVPLGFLSLPELRTGHQRRRVGIRLALAMLTAIIALLIAGTLL